MNKAAQVKIATAIDMGFINKCAEYGLDWKDQKDSVIIRELMNQAYEDTRKV